MHHRVLVRKPLKTAWLNRPALTTARLTGCGATVICCSGAGLPTEGSVQEGFADHVAQLSKVITYTPPSGPT
jgi:hypothetical protein